MSRLRILLDECLDQRLVKEIPYHFVKTVPEMGWAGLKNGELLRKAQQAFDVFITSDQNLSFQQKLPRFNISVVILCSLSNKLEDLLAIFPKVIKQLNSLKLGQAIYVKA